ncbi:hypothetical protein [Streptomyces sp. UG1]|uniref:hypothetical protein n=1 Tax=Streptomyces sp. UG1 TaxID=3417652 RepID=UPI003CEF55FD
MKALLFGAVLGILLLWPTALSLTADLARQPTVITFALGVLARPAITRRIGRWTA